MNKSIKKILQIGDSKPISEIKIMNSSEARLCANVLSYAEKLYNTELRNNGSCSPQRRNS